MNFITAIKTCFRKYADFSGRASRSEYWYFALFIALVSTALTMINLPMLSTVFSLATLLPSLATMNMASTPRARKESRSLGTL